MNNSIFQSNWDKIKEFFVTYAWVSWIVLIIFIVIGLIVWIVKTIPQLEVFWSKIITPIAKKLKHKKLIKAAIKSNIKGNVNTAVKYLNSELPKDWRKEMEIEWTVEENKDDFLKDREAVIRMRPLENQDMNFVFAVYYYFKKSIFPMIKSAVPENHLESSAIYLSNRLLKEKNESLVGIFEENILEVIVSKNNKILNYLDEYHLMDSRGFFTAVFLREAEEIIKKLRFTPKRVEIEKEIDKVIEHIKLFIRGLKRGLKKGKIPDKEWLRLDCVTKYGLLLIANPQKTKSGIKQYLNRVKSDLDNGVKRLYVFGAERERSFANRVIKKIVQNIPQYELIETFNTSNDYRKEHGGIYALFKLKV